MLAALPRIHQVFRTQGFHDAATGAPLTGHQLRILANLDDHDPTMIGEVAEHMGVTLSTMSLNLKRLQERGFVARSRDPADRRVMNVRLTEAGRAARDATSLVDPGRVAAVLRLLSPEERRQAVGGVAILADAADRFRARGDEHLLALTGQDEARGDE